MPPITLEDVRRDRQVLEAIKESDKSLAVLGYTNHGLRHLNLAAGRAQAIANALRLGKRETELAAIAAFCHDMGNFLGRTQHHYWGALLFHQMFQDRMTSDELLIVVQAIANHDKEEMKFTSRAAAITVLADKSDVHRSRVRKKPMKEIMGDIHNRVNYAVTFSDLRLDPKKKRVDLILKIDANFVSMLEYFEIFTERMRYCRTAAEFLGWDFGLVANGAKLI